MAASSEDLQNVRRLVKHLGIKVETVDDLQRILAALKAGYNPDAVRVKAVQTISTTAISVSLGAAGIVSFFALAALGDGRVSPALGTSLIAVLIVMWALAGAVSLAAVLLGLRWLKQAPPRPLPEPAPTVPERPALGSENITTAENIKVPREIP